MNIAFFSTLPFEQAWFDPYAGQHPVTYIPQTLTRGTVHLADGHRAVCAVVNDDLSHSVLEYHLNGTTIPIKGDIIWYSPAGDSTYYPWEITNIDYNKRVLY